MVRFARARREDVASQRLDTHEVRSLCLLVQLAYHGLHAHRWSVIYSNAWLGAAYQELARSASMRSRVLEQVTRNAELAERRLRGLGSAATGHDGSEHHLQIQFDASALAEVVAGRARRAVLTQAENACVHNTQKRAICTGKSANCSRMEPRSAQALRYPARKDGAY